jgi:hypothetical protein
VLQLKIVWSKLAGTKTLVYVYIMNEQTNTMSETKTLTTEQIKQAATEIDDIICNETESNYWDGEIIQFDEMALVIDLGLQVIQLGDDGDWDTQPFAYLEKNTTIKSAKVIDENENEFDVDPEQLKQILNLL